MEKIKRGMKNEENPNEQIRDREREYSLKLSIRNKIRD
jgi:hypothetical protein